MEDLKNKPELNEQRAEAAMPTPRTVIKRADSRDGNQVLDWHPDRGKAARIEPQGQRTHLILKVSIQQPKGHTFVMSRAQEAAASLRSHSHLRPLCGEVTWTLASEA